MKIYLRTEGYYSGKNKLVEVVENHLEKLRRCRSYCDITSNPQLFYINGRLLDQHKSFLVNGIKEGDILDCSKFPLASIITLYFINQIQRLKNKDNFHQTLTNLQTLNKNLKIVGDDLNSIKKLQSLGSEGLVSFFLFNKVSTSSFINLQEMYNDFLRLDIPNNDPLDHLIKRLYNKKDTAIASLTTTNTASIAASTATIAIAAVVTPKPQNNINNNSNRLQSVVVELVDDEIVFVEQKPRPTQNTIVLPKTLSSPHPPHSILKNSNTTNKIPLPAPLPTPPPNKKALPLTPPHSLNNSNNSDSYVDVENDIEVIATSQPKRLNITPTSTTNTSTSTTSTPLSTPYKPNSRILNDISNQISPILKANSNNNNSNKNNNNDDELDFFSNNHNVNINEYTLDGNDNKINNKSQNNSNNSSQSNKKVNTSLGKRSHSLPSSPFSLSPNLTNKKSTANISSLSLPVDVDDYDDYDDDIFVSQSSTNNNNNSNSSFNSISNNVAINSFSYEDFNMETEDDCLLNEALQRSKEEFQLSQRTQPQTTTITTTTTPNRTITTTTTTTNLSKPESNIDKTFKIPIKLTAQPKEIEISTPPKKRKPFKRYSTGSLPSLDTLNSPLPTRFKFKTNLLDFKPQFQYPPFALLLSLSTLSTSYSSKGHKKTAKFKDITTNAQQFTNLFDPRNPEYTAELKTPKFALTNTLMINDCIELEEDQEDSYYITDLGTRYARIFQDYYDDYIEFCGINKTKLDLSQSNVVIVIDSQENIKGDFKRNFKEMGITSIERQLPSADFLFLSSLKRGNQEMMFPYIFERKTWKDLSASEKDGRSIRQMTKMKAYSKLKGRFYIVEGDPSNYNPDVAISTTIEELKKKLDLLTTADNFTILKSNSPFETTRLLAIISKMLSSHPELSNLNNLLPYEEFKERVNDEHIRQYNTGGIGFTAGIIDHTDLIIEEHAKLKSEKVWFQMTIDQFKEYIVSNEYRSQVKKVFNNDSRNCNIRNRILIINDFNQFKHAQSKAHNQLFQDYLYHRYNNRNVNDLQKSYRSKDTLLLSDHLDYDIIHYYLLELIISFNLQIFTQFHHSERSNVESFSSFSKSIESGLKLLNPSDTKFRNIFAKPISSFKSIKEKIRDQSFDKRNNNNNGGVGFIDIDDY